MKLYEPFSNVVKLDGQTARALPADAPRRFRNAAVAFERAADHGVSEALYLSDLDANGVELCQAHRFGCTFGILPANGKISGTTTTPLVSLSGVGQPATG
jgi:hypothetical protein